MADGKSPPAHARRVLQAVLPYLTAAAALGMVAALIAAIYFTLLELQWIAFLVGILFAAIVAMISQASRAQWLIARRSAQLARMRELLARESSRRKHAENALAAAQSELALLRAPPPAPGAATRADVKAPAGQSLYVESMTEQLTGWTSAAERLTAALQNNEFCLYGQKIAPLAAGASPLCEILIRLIEEEQNLMPPGAFLPLAEEHGLMPTLDRWVVRNVLEWLANRRRTVPDHPMIICCVNLSSATMADPDFATYVREQRQVFDIPVAGLCFEVDENDAAAHASDSARQVLRLKDMGCRITLSGFGRNTVSLDILKNLSVDFIKIDGNVILNILRDEVDMAKVAAINRVAHTAGIKTIAEFVESDEILAKLRKLGIDYAQGFGISRPRPLNEIDFTSP